MSPIALPPTGAQWCIECAAGVLAGQARKLLIGIVTYNGSTYCEEHYAKIRGIPPPVRTATRDANGVVHIHELDEEVVLNNDGRAMIRKVQS